MRRLIVCKECKVFDVPIIMPIFDQCTKKNNKDKLLLSYTHRHCNSQKF